MTEVKHSVFQNKALDYNKLLTEQSKGKLLEKILKFPLIAMIKYDGHYCTIEANGGNYTFTSSGGVRYTHSYNSLDLPDGTYIAERIAGKGKLGESRRGVALEGSIGAKYAKPTNIYVIHNRLSGDTYSDILVDLATYIPDSILPQYRNIKDKVELDAYMKEATRDGWEGLMLIQPDYVFKSTKSRHVDFCKYKKRPTADLLCIDFTYGEGKYEGLIGALVLQDSEGRIVSVGSGMTDEDRQQDAEFFIDKVLEIEYEQIADTYIQATFSSDTIGVTIRNDKGVEDID